MAFELYVAPLAFWMNDPNGLFIKRENIIFSISTILIHQNGDPYIGSVHLKII
nr:hypothetical protein [Thalassobacillus sp. C254]